MFAPSQASATSKKRYKTCSYVLLLCERGRTTILREADQSVVGDAAEDPSMSGDVVRARNQGAQTHQLALAGVPYASGSCRKGLQKPIPPFTGEKEAFHSWSYNF